MPFSFVAPIAAGVSAATAVGSALAGSGSQSASIAAGQQQADAAENQAYSDAKANEAPYISTGTNALSGVADLAGLNGPTGDANALASFQQSPGFAYQEQQGLSAIDNGAASTGTLRSGNTIRAEETLGSNLANTDFQTYYNRLAGLATGGQTATNALDSVGVGTAQGIASTAASSSTAQANITGNTAKTISSAVTGLAGNASVQNALAGLGSTPATNYEAGVSDGSGGIKV